MRHAFVTIVTKSYLAHARTLCESLKRFNGAPVYVLFADDIDGFVDPSQEAFTTLEVPDILPAAHDGMKFYYNAFEFCNALRPFLHQYFLSSTDIDSWMYLDADILVTHSLDEIWAGFDNGSVFLSPHVLRPTPSELKDPGETALLRFGVFNSGFLGIRRTRQAQEFVDWFKDRLVTHCFDEERNVFVDQLWLNLVPGFFSEARIVDHYGLNVGYWNLHERPLRRGVSSEYATNGQPLLFVHFSRWSLEKDLDWSYGRPFADRQHEEIALEIGRQYRDSLVRNGLEVCREWPYSFAKFTGGSKIPLEARRCYYDLIFKNEAPAESPFALEGFFRRQERKRLRRRLRSMLQHAVGGSID